MIDVVPTIPPGLSFPLSLCQEKKRPLIFMIRNRNHGTEQQRSRIVLSLLLSSHERASPDRSSWEDRLPAIAARQRSGSRPWWVPSLSPPCIHRVNKCRRHFFSLSLFFFFPASHRIASHRIGDVTIEDPFARLDKHSSSKLTSRDVLPFYYYILFYYFLFYLFYYFLHFVYFIIIFYFIYFIISSILSILILYSILLFPLFYLF